MKGLHAGYVSGALWQEIRERRLPSALDWMDVISALSHFVIDTDVAQGGSLPPEWAVFDNLLCRGLPTLPSIRLENGLAEATRLVEVSEGGKQDHGSVSVQFDASVDVGMRELLARALCICATKVTLQPSTGFVFPEFGSGEDNTKFDSDAERTFWNGPLAKLLGPGGMQLVLRQRPLDSIASQDFPEQRVDVAVELPGWHKDGQLARGLVLEVDGTTHGVPAKRSSDAKRDEACQKNGWATTYRHRLWKDIPASQDVDPQHTGVQKLQGHQYLRFLNRNAKQPIQDSEAGRRARYLALAPFAAARIQRVLLELVKGGRLSVTAPEWTVVVVDRDNLPGIAQLAVDDMREWLAQIHALYRPEAVVPTFHVVQAPDASAAPSLQTQPDAVIDLSVEMRYGVGRQAHSSWDTLLGAGRTVVVRSDYYRRVPHHKLAFSEPLTPQIAGEALERTLTFFLQNVFRKSAFRPKQVEIISRALRGESVIALLPTGAGKSITYQLPTLLQNGMSAVVAPIKSLMKDQDDNLRAAGISCCAFINSMSTAAEKRFNTELMIQGCLRFAFISPERLIIREFRDALVRMKDEGRAHCAYVVVDEAHCVSEWGHDFRTSYLRLGANARKFCPTRWPKLPLLALTGTASFEVLDDVHLELGFERGDDISVRPEKMERDNLKFNVVRIPPLVKPPAGAAEKSVSETVGKAKLGALPSVLKDLTRSTCEKDPTPFLQMTAGSGLVFCPHAGLKGGLHGVVATTKALCEAVGGDEAKKIGMYFGSAEDAGGMGFDPIAVQTDFKANRLRILACTKAFGMGIDKPDIRFTLHFNIPPSLESFYQEAGRAGRDGEDAHCWLLYAGTEVPEYGHSLDFHLNHQFHRNSFPGADLEEAKAIEMLDQNRVPGHAALRDLETHLEEETGIEFSVKPWTSPDGSLQRIYVNHPDLPACKVYLFVKPNGDISYGATNPFPAHHLLCQEAKKWLLANRPGGVVWQDWLFRDAAIAFNAGMEDVLAQTGPDETPRLCLSFENGYIEEIAHCLGMSPADVRKATGFIRGVDDFLAKMPAKELKKPDIEAWVRSIFPKIRLREHTFRALYRLSTLGVVTDFEADYANKTLTADLAHLQPGQCRENLRRYLGKHAPMEAEGYLRLADQSPCATELRRCLHALITFVYDRIAKQRVEALTIMEQTCVRGVEDPEAFREAVTYFFDSLYLPRLRPHLQQYDAELVFTTIEDTSGSAAKLNHLLGACNRLLPENPENAAFRALRGYAIALLGYAERDAVSAMESAAEKFASVLGWERAEKLAFLDRLRRCFVMVPGVSTSVIDAVILGEHGRWLQKFNVGNQLSNANQTYAPAHGLREVMVKGEIA